MARGFPFADSPNFVILTCSIMDLAKCIGSAIAQGPTNVASPFCAKTRAEGDSHDELEPNGYGSEFILHTYLFEYSLHTIPAVPDVAIFEGRLSTRSKSLSEFPEIAFHGGRTITKRIYMFFPASLWIRHLKVFFVQFHQVPWNPRAFQEQNVSIQLEFRKPQKNQTRFPICASNLPTNGTLARICARAGSRASFAW